MNGSILWLYICFTKITYLYYLFYSYSILIFKKSWEIFSNLIFVALNWAIPSYGLRPGNSKEHPTVLPDTSSASPRYCIRAHQTLENYNKRKETQTIKRLRESEEELSDGFLRLVLLGSSIITAAVQAGGRSSWEHAQKQSQCNWTDWTAAAALTAWASEQWAEEKRVSTQEQLSCEAGQSLTMD